MAEAGVKTIDLPAASVLDTLLGNRDGSTSQIAVSNLLTQLLGNAAFPAFALTSEVTTAIAAAVATADDGAFNTLALAAGQSLAFGTPIVHASIPAGTTPHRIWCDDVGEFRWEHGCFIDNGVWKFTTVGPASRWWRSSVDGSFTFQASTNTGAIGDAIVWGDEFKIKADGAYVGGVKLATAAGVMLLIHGAESAPFALSQGALLTFVHGLGYRPKNIGLWLVCTAAHEGYAIGDEVYLGSQDRYYDWGASPWLPNDTEVRVKIGNAGISIIAATSGGSAALRNAQFANWKMIVRAS